VGTTSPIFATRQMMKRIATIVMQRHPAGQVDAQSAGQVERCEHEKQCGSLGGIAARPSEAADQPEVVDIHCPRERSHEHTAGDRIQPEIRWLCRDTTTQKLQSAIHARDSERIVG
jgi:hypothetical protein